MHIEVGKIYELIHSNVVETVVFNLEFEEIARLSLGQTFVALELIGEFETTAEYQSIYPKNNKIFKVKILTSEGKVGFCSFWASEIKIVEN